MSSINQPQGISALPQTAASSPEAAKQTTTPTTATQITTTTVSAPAQTMASLERATTPVPLSQTLALFAAPLPGEPTKGDLHNSQSPIQPDNAIMHGISIIDNPTERHTGATPAPQIPPSSGDMPPPTPSTTTVITLPPAPEHITLTPAIPPVLMAPPPNRGPVESNKSASKTEPVIHPVERIDTVADLPAHSTIKSRRNSASDGVPAKSEKMKSLGLSLPTLGRPASSGDLRGGQPSPLIPRGAIEVLVASIHLHNVTSPAPEHADPLSVCDLYAGRNKKHFEIHRHLLVTKVPYFHDLFSHDSSPDTSRLTFEDLDEYGFALFVRWLYGGQLHGPSDFHTFQHYLSLYVLALQFGIEGLQDEVMDKCRAYYHSNSMTAPAYRLEYIYTFTSQPNHMRNFLTATAAYRCLCEAPEGPEVYLSDSLKSLLFKQGDFAVDFAESLIKLSKNGLVDVRKGNPSIFHVHSDGGLSDWEGLEPYQSA